MAREETLFAQGVALGSLLASLILAAFAAAFYTQFARYQEAIVECEKSLPRDQRCVVIGVPEVKK